MAQWKEETQQLRRIALACGLREEVKWGKPCFTYQNKNIVLIQGFKEYCALLFFKGYLLKGELLQKTGENTRVGRQARFTNAKDIVKNEAALKALIYQAMEAKETSPPPKAALKIP